MLKEYIKQIIDFPIYLLNKVNLRVRSCDITGKIILKGYLKVYGKGKLIINNGVKINSRYRNNPIGGQTFTSFYICENAQIIIGNNTGISNTTMYARKKITIGNYVKIGGNVKIYDTDFHSLNYEMRRNVLDSDIKTEEVIIGNDVFIGAGSIILKGVVIGEKSIIGAGSVVTKSIPANEIWAGNPARFVRTIERAMVLNG